MDRAYERAGSGTSPAGMWTSHDTQLVVHAIIAIAAIVLLVAGLKLHAFLALTPGALFMGLAAGLGVDKLLMSVPDTIKTWSVTETLISVVGFGCVLVLSLVV